MLGPAGKTKEPPQSPTNPLRKFTGKVAQVASQLSQKSMPRLRHTASGGTGSSSDPTTSEGTTVNNSNNLNSSSISMESGSSVSSINSLSSSSPGPVLYWDVRVPKDNQVFDRKSVLLGHHQPHHHHHDHHQRHHHQHEHHQSSSSFEKSSPEVINNITLLLQQFPQVKALNTFQSLADQLFAYKEHSFTTLFYVTPSDIHNINDDETLKFVSTQFAHIPGVFIVLSDVTNLWASFARLGALDVSNASISDKESSHSSQPKPSYWASIIGKARHDQLESRTSQLKIILGLEEKSVSTPIAANLITKFEFPSIHVLGDFSPSLTSLVNQDRLPIIQASIRSWDFYAHDLKYDELLAATYLMIRHALDSPGLENYIIPDSKLISWLLVVRNCYHATNPYHNFRHAVDVVQATFYFLLTIGVFPKFGIEKQQQQQQPSDTSTPLTVIDGLSLLVAALGHDVGHPGVTNAFLVSSNAPLAKIYNDRSVLESYHSAAFNQILKEYWPQLIEDVDARNMITESVLATDMAVHFDYMKRAESKGTVGEGVSPNDPKKLRILLGCLILKCADISNVSRKLDISSRWGSLLVEEFGGLNDLEVDLGLKDPPPPPSKPVSKEYRSKLLGEGQIFFIQTYALPLFTTVSRMLPAMNFATQQIQKNVAAWNSE